MPANVTFIAPTGSPDNVYSFTQFSGGDAQKPTVGREAPVFTFLQPSVAPDNIYLFQSDSPVWIGVSSGLGFTGYAGSGEFGFSGTGISSGLGFTGYAGNGEFGFSGTGISDGLGFTGYAGSFLEGVFGTGVSSGFGLTGYAGSGEFGFSGAGVSSGLGFTGYAGGLPPFEVVVRKEIIGRRYYCEFSADVIPISSMNGYIRQNRSTQLTVVCPDGNNYIAKILANANSAFRIRAVEVYSDGSKQEFLSVPYNMQPPTYDRGARSFSVVMTGTGTIPERTIPLKHILSKVIVESLQVNGLRRFRIPYASEILPNDIISYNNIDMTVGRVSINIGSTGRLMELTEAG